MSDDGAPDSRQLPALRPRKRVDPFASGMAAALDHQGDRDLSAQVPRRDEPGKSPPRATAASASTEASSSRLHARIPTSLMIELQVHCARNRTSIQHVVQTLIEAFLAKHRG